MKKIVIIIMGLILASPLWATTYYLAPAGGGGNDSNNGTSSGTPWLSPNHAVNCGDVLLAAAGNYSAANFYNQKWGHVTCAAKNDVAWVKCVTFDTCKIATTAMHGMFISASFWGVQGWEITTAGSGTNQCLNIAPDYGTPVQIDHIIIANNIMNGCTGDGIASGNGYGTSIGSDYLVYIGNIVYASGTNFCAAGLSFWAPVASDTAPGTHYYMAGNFAWGNQSNCGDGEGIIYDTIDGVEAGNTPQPYSQQMVAENNLLIYNAGPGIQVDLNMNGTPALYAPIYFTHNTVAYNCLGPSTGTFCAELVEGTTVKAESWMNLVVAPTQYAFGGNSIVHYGSAAVSSPSVTNKIYNEWAYSAYGSGVGSISSTGFVAGPNNITSTDPVFAGPATPGAPSCGAFATTTACMATVIANFTPTVAAAKAYGYQQPSSTSVFNPFYPQWLCTVTNMPAGLHTPGCVTGQMFR